ncbi:TPA: toxic anion resistance protein [Escherichia coli]|nr:toxic anion resistance protein [Salmonella enterica]EEC2753787.1 toxic anion resistance protein [Salmonella enterica]EKY8230928.1 toxic anion resistance protein [Salmonella enterica]HDS3454424.1 toxic anion resistance protein [Escherichia coli]
MNTTTTTTTTTTTETRSFSLTPSSLAQFGLRQEDADDIRALVQTIDVNSPDTVYEFGHNVAEHTSRYTDDLLDKMGRRNTGEAGKKLNEILSLARANNEASAGLHESRLPVIGPLINRIINRGRDFTAQFQSTKEQMEALLAEVNQTQGNLSESNRMLDQMHGEVTKEYRLLGVHIAAGKLCVNELQDKLDTLKQSVGDDPLKVHEVADMEMLVSNLNKRIGSLIVSQQSALQMLPMIRIIQGVNRNLVDEFHTVKQVTFPSMKRQFLMTAALTEEKDAEALAGELHDVKNELLISNAKLLRQNAVAVMKANQRLGGDIKVLREVQDTLFKTVEDVVKIQQEADLQLRDVEKNILDMRENLRARLDNKTALTEA